MPSNVFVASTVLEPPQTDACSDRSSDGRHALSAAAPLALPRRESALYPRSIAHGAIARPGERGVQSFSSSRNHTGEDRENLHEAMKAHFAPKHVVGNVVVPS